MNALTKNQRYVLLLGAMCSVLFLSLLLQFALRAVEMETPPNKADWPSVGFLTFCVLMLRFLSQSEKSWALSAFKCLSVVGYSASCGFVIWILLGLKWV